MKKLAKFAIVVTMLLCMAASASAYSIGDHVTLAPENKGDLLFYPFYIAVDGGWETKLWVVNTSNTSSVVAKLVIRSWKNSEELLDFLIYLSPTDIWTGILRYDAVLGPVIYSEDGSALISIDPLQFASADFPMNQPLFNADCPDDSDDLGYVEIIESTSWNNADMCAANPAAAGENCDYTAGPVSKTWIKRTYDQLSCSFVDQWNGKVCAPFGVEITTLNSLAGWMELGLPVIDLNSMIQSTTMKNYDNESKLNTGDVTKLGGIARNNLGEVEAALAKNDIAMPYYNSSDAFSFHIFNFPTKLTIVDPDCDCFGSESDYFWDFVNTSEGDYCTIFYRPYVFDWEENRPGGGTPFSGGEDQTFDLPYEVNILVSLGFPFSMGWVNYYMFDLTVDNPFSTTLSTKNDVDVITFADVPVIGVILHYRFNALAMAYPAHTFGRVYAEVDDPCDTNLGYVDDYQLVNRECDNGPYSQGPPWQSWVDVFIPPTE